jgi:hypothetical protein
VVHAANKTKCNTLAAHIQAGHYGFLEYADGFRADGTFIHTDLFFDQNVLRRMGFLAASRFSKRPAGMNGMSGSIGLGYMGEQQLHKSLGKVVQSYDTFPVVLERNGYTNSNAYSMWLNSTQDGKNFTGTIVFGGYDKAYFGRESTPIPLLYRRSGIVIPLDQISLEERVVFSQDQVTVFEDYEEEVDEEKEDKDQHEEDQEEEADQEDDEDQEEYEDHEEEEDREAGEESHRRRKGSMPVMLDTGTFGIYLPHDTFKALAASIGPYKFTENRVRKVAIFDDCDKINETQILQFMFGNINISFPLEGIIRNVTEEEIIDEKYPSRFIRAGKKQCVTHGKSGSLCVNLN